MKKAFIAFLSAIGALILWLIWKPLIIASIVFFLVYVFTFNPDEKDKKGPPSEKEQN